MAETCYSDNEVLEIFIESVDELLASDFLTEAYKSGISTQMKWSEADGLMCKRTGPRHDAVKAMLLTLRFFCQNSEQTSLENMEGRLSRMDIDAALKERFKNSRANFNLYLDSPPKVGFPAESGAGTRREIFCTFLYGIFAHATPSKRRRIRTWEGEPYFEHVRAEFDCILLEFLKTVSVMAGVCRECLALVRV